MHYGMKFPAAAGFRRAGDSTDQDHRGGLLTQAAVLSLTSDGTRHRPVHRGVWVSETVFGRTPPPPPPNVEPLQPTPADKPKATIRRSAAGPHNASQSAASCHRKIDPLGFAFENYDAIGRWRTTERFWGRQRSAWWRPTDPSPMVAPMTGPINSGNCLPRISDRFAECCSSSSWLRTALRLRHDDR
jgi:hypothetical protein